MREGIVRNLGRSDGWVKEMTYASFPAIRDSGTIENQMLGCGLKHVIVGDILHEHL